MKRKRSSLIVAGAGIILAFSIVGALAPVISPYDPHAISGDSLLAPSVRHIFGTNDIGQDIFSEVVWGARRSLSVGLSSGALVVAGGVVIGAGAALAGGLVEKAVMRVIDLFLAMPGLPLLTVIATLVGPSTLTLIAVIGFIGWPMTARIIRSQTISLRSRGYVGSARGFGANFFYVIRRHLAPALGPILTTMFATMASVAIFLESGLAFLGLGDPIGVSWGSILNRAVNQQGMFLSNVWTWWVLPPGLVITVAVLGFTFLAIGTDPRFNPRDSRNRENLKGATDWPKGAGLDSPGGGTGPG